MLKKQNETFLVPSVQENLQNLGNNIEHIFFQCKAKKLIKNYFQMSILYYHPVYRVETNRKGKKSDTK